MRQNKKNYKVMVYSKVVFPWRQLRVHTGQFLIVILSVLFHFWLVLFCIHLIIFFVVIFERTYYQKFRVSNRESFLIFFLGIFYLAFLSRASSSMINDQNLLSKISLWIQLLYLVPLFCMGFNIQHLLQIFQLENQTEPFLKVILIIYRKCVGRIIYPCSTSAAHTCSCMA